VTRDQVVGLPLAEVFANFPVALLERVWGEETARVEDRG
jgi:hypothetical protein